jgi:hypothetical protein
MPGVYGFRWHDDECERRPDGRYTDKNGRKHFFCVTHNQWADEVPVRTETTFTYGGDLDRVVAESVYNSEDKEMALVWGREAGTVYDGAYTLCVSTDMQIMWELVEANGLWCWITVAGL